MENRFRGVSEIYRCDNGGMKRVKEKEKKTIKEKDGMKI